MNLNEVFYKGPNSGMDAEDQQHGPGGSNQDTSKSAPVPTEAAEGGPKSLGWDPFSIVEQLGYKEKRSALTYGTIRAMKYRAPIVNTIIQTRVDQVAAFAKPSHNRFDYGFKFQRRMEPDANMTAGERKWAKEMSTIILRTGVTDNPRGRTPFEAFIRMFAEDSLTYDQACFEVVPNRRGLPAEWYVVDSSSIRLADTGTTFQNEDDPEKSRYVQVYDGMIITEYNQEELCFGVRNPTSDMNMFGYGFSEIEKLINVITAQLFAWEYNQKAFSQGSAQKGILNFKGPVPERQLKAFRRHWYTMLSGVENAWRTPITNADDLQWIPMNQSNKDMEYSAWFDFLIKVTCSMFDMDPVEVNFKYGNTGQSSGLGGDNSNRDKIIESRERGLHPLLRFIADCINRYIIWPINENMELAFVGLNASTHDEVASRNQMRVKSTDTVNELRAEEGKPPIEGGDIILDPVYGQQLMAKQQQEQMAAEGGDDEDEDFSALLDGDDEDEDAAKDEKKAKDTEGLGGRPDSPGKPGEESKPGAGSGFKPGMEKSLGYRGKQVFVDIKI